MSGGREEGVTGPAREYRAGVDRCVLLKGPNCAAGAANRRIKMKMEKVEELRKTV